MAGVRIQKLMAAAGLGSRRALEKQIGEGRVRINNLHAPLGQNAFPGDTIEFERARYRVINSKNAHRTLIYNKPEGQITSRSDPQGRPTVFESLPPLREGRWIAVGRLDINTSGLLLMTTDGALAHAMMHPSNRVDREYACRIRGKATPAQIQNLLTGVELSDGPAQFSDIKDAGGNDGNHWYHVVILEGRNREVRRLWKSQGFEISRLKRVRYGAAFLPKRLHMGQWSEISEKDHRVLRQDVNLDDEDNSLALQALDRGKRSPGPRKKRPGTGRAPQKSTRQLKASTKKRK